MTNLTFYTLYNYYFNASQVIDDFSQNTIETTRVEYHKISYRNFVF